MVSDFSNRSSAIRCCPTGLGNTLNFGKEEPNFQTSENPMNSVMIDRVLRNKVALKELPLKNLRLVIINIVGYALLS